jgi:hypothetical protein
MKPPKPSRVRRVMKWAGLVCCLVLVIATAISFQWWISYGYVWPKCAHGPVTITLVWGVLSCGGPPRAVAVLLPEEQLATRRFGVNSVNSPPLGVLLPHMFRPRLQRAYPASPFLVGRVQIPLPPVIIVLAAGTAFLWHRDRRMPPGHCKECGYDLTGNVSGICPECGTAIADDVKAGGA